MAGIGNCKWPTSAVWMLNLFSSWGREGFLRSCGFAYPPSNFCCQLLHPNFIAFLTLLFHGVIDGSFALRRIFPGAGWLVILSSLRGKRRENCGVCRGGKCVKYSQNGCAKVLTRRKVLNIIWIKIKLRRNTGEWLRTALSYVRHWHPVLAFYMNFHVDLHEGDRRVQRTRGAALENRSIGLTWTPYNDSISFDSWKWFKEFTNSLCSDKEGLFRRKKSGPAIIIRTPEWRSCLDSFGKPQRIRCRMANWSHFRVVSTEWGYSAEFSMENHTVR